MGRRVPGECPTSQSRMPGRRRGNPARARGAARRRGVDIRGTRIARFYSGGAESERAVGESSRSLLDPRTPSRLACREMASRRENSPRPSGLRRDLGTIESYAALIGILIGAGIFKVTGQAWLLTGPSVILAYIVLAPAILATSVAYSVFLSTPLGREPGGEYTHISRTFGGFRLAFIGAWLKIISYTGALAYLARAFADYAQQLVRVDATLLAVASLV